MKIIFEDKSYLEISKSKDDDKLIIVISAKDQSNPLKKITNSVEVEISKLKEFIASL